MNENLKKIIKRFFDLLLLPFKKWDGILVLFYHSVNDTFYRSHSIKMFEMQLQWLLKNDYKFITVNKLSEYKNSKKVICLTFDDGYLDNYKIVLPILNKYNIKATFFVVTEWFDLDQSDRHHSYDLPFMKKEHVKILYENGMEIGCHTHSHRQATDLLQDSRKLFIKDLKTNKNILEKILGSKVTSFAYPNGQKGSYNDETNKIVESLFERGFTTIHSKHKIYKKINGRVEMSHLDNFYDFISKIMGRRRYLYFYQNLVNQSRKWYK